MARRRRFANCCRASATPQRKARDMIARFSVAAAHVGAAAHGDSSTLFFWYSGWSLAPGRWWAPA